jgi:tetratricopeptide (TPR) repeat protein
MFDVLARLAARRPRAAVLPAQEEPGAYGRGLAALSAGRHEDALAAFEAAREGAAPGPEGTPAGRERARIENKRGVALVALRRVAEAREAFLAALEARAAFAPPLVNLGNLSLEEGRTAEAIAYYERAIAADPEYAPAYLHFGIACKRSGRRAEAVRHFRTAARLQARGDRSES